MKLVGLRRKSPEGIVPGDKFSDLTVIGYYGHNRRYQALWAVKCVCGNLKAVLGCNLKQGNSTSCGNHRKHGEGRMALQTPEYRTWMSMISRCRSRRIEQRRCYLDRGITVCKRWARSFESFLKDVGRKPSSEHSLDRIDNNKGYFPSNVRWADKRTQARNTRTAKKLTISGITRTECEWAEISGIPRTTIRNRVKRGWPAEQVISKVMWKHRRGRCG